jgi:hypothetical protein
MTSINLAARAGAIFLALPLILGASPLLVCAQDEAEEAAPAAGAVMIGISDEQFDSWVFGNRKEPQVRRQLENHLAMHVERLGLACGASDAQKKKLLLAGKGDIKRFFEKVQRAREKFDEMKRDQNAINQIFQDLQPLQIELNAGLFGQKSLFEKTSHNIFTGDQAAAFEQAERERFEFRFRARVEAVVSMLDEQLVFTAEQRKNFIELILRESRPPRRASQYDQYVVLYHMARLPDEKLAAVLDARQLKLFKPIGQQFQGIDAFLRTNGLLDDEAAQNQEAAETVRQKGNE